MGLAASSNGAASGGSGGQGHNSSTSSGDVIRRCHCYSISYLSLDRRCYRHSLTFNHSSEKTAINPKQKKKRSYGFATFKKKLIGKRRHCKGSDHNRCFREYFIDCPSDILKSLLGQFEALTLLKDLSVQADLARPPAQTLGQNLGELFESESCCDIVLVYGGHRIPAHKSILMARCPYFSRHLAFHDTNEHHVRTRGCLVPLVVLRSVLKYLYSGNTDLLNISGQTEAIAMLEDEFGIPNSLESDVSFLLDTLSLGDLRLVFEEGSSDYLCHRTIVAARSPFLARVIAKISSNSNGSGCAAGATGSDSNIMEIRLDSEIIPARYARVLLHAIYMDSLDLRLIESNSGRPYGISSNSEAAIMNSSAAADDRNINVQDSINLYEIGRFLEFNFLAQACEDLLMQLMSVDNVVTILNWSLNAHGSAWISRQTLQFLEEEFFNVSNKMEVLGSLSQSTIVRLLKSDFTQASESEVLQALVKWGEHQLKLAAEDHQYSSTAASTAPITASLGTATLGRGKNASASKRREVCDSELKEMLSNMISQIRVPHVLPRDRSSEVLDMALQRNLFPVLPNFTSQVNESTKYSPWDPKSNNGLFVRPRLFLPYFEECKKLIQDRCAQDPEIIASNSPCVSVPDTLYMLRSGNKLDGFHGSSSTEDLLEFQTSRVPDNEIISRMIERMKKLVNSHSVQRAFCSNFNDVNEVMNLVELRVVREFNLPDTYASVLQKARRRSMSSSDFDDKRSTMSSRMFYHSSVRAPPLLVDDFSGSPRTGPDVTLATNAVSTLTLQQHSFHPSSAVKNSGQESPDLVNTGELVEGATGIYNSSSWKTSPQQRMSQSYSTGPSHMYL